MDQLPQSDLWSTFSPQTQRHLVALWTELLGRHLQAHRGLPMGGSDESPDAHPAAAPGADRDGLRAAIDQQATHPASGEYAAPVPAHRAGRTLGLAETADLRH